MKNFEKLKINPEKLVGDSDLLRLRGGEENPCGSGFTKRECLYWPDYTTVPLMPFVGPFIVCVGPGQDANQLVTDMYIGMYPNIFVACADHIVVE